MPKRAKIALIGAGNIGGELASFAARRELGDVVLLDIPDKEGVAKGKALDIAQACALDGYDARLTGTSNYADSQGLPTWCIVTAGVPRKPGMSRDDLLSINLKIIRSVAEGIQGQRPERLVIVISNPLDAMVSRDAEGHRVSRTSKVIGMAGVLDSARFQQFIAAEIGCSTKESQRPRARRPRRHHGPRPLLLQCERHPRLPARLEGEAQRHRRAHQGRRRRNREAHGHQRLRGPGGGSHRHGRELTSRTRSASLPCAVYLERSSTATRASTSACPCQIGKDGAEKIIEIELSTPTKRRCSTTSAAAVKENFGQTLRL
jgi:malate/lactate dehydrogenase